MKRNLFVDTLASEILNLILEHDHASTGSKVTKDTFSETIAAYRPGLVPGFFVLATPTH